MTIQTSTFCFPTMIRFGAGVRHELADYLREEKFRRVLVVTDQGLTKTDIPKGILALLKDFDAEIFSEIWGNPVKSQVLAGVARFRAHKAQALVALGGGAAVDVAKAIALMVHHPGDLFDYEDGKSNALPFDREMPYLVALPTTAGTGSEVGRSTVISADETKIKKIIFSPRLLPKMVFADPELTLNLPPSITAATGMDALAHAVESFLAKGYHPFCEGVALEGLRIVAENLERAVKNGQDLEARGQMLVASMMGAVAFQKGLGVTHSCAHALSTICDLHHGLANGIMLPYAMTFNLPAGQDKMKRMASLIGLEPKAEKFIGWLQDVKRDIGIPKSLREAGVEKKHVPQLVKIAVQDVCHQSNPRGVTQKDFEKIFSEALE